MLLKNRPRRTWPKWISTTANIRHFSTLISQVQMTPLFGTESLLRLSYTPSVIKSGAGATSPRFAKRRSRIRGSSELNEATNIADWPAPADAVCQCVLACRPPLSVLLVNLVWLLALLCILHEMDRINRLISHGCINNTAAHFQAERSQHQFIS